MSDSVFSREWWQFKGIPTLSFIFSLLFLVISGINMATIHEISEQHEKLFRAQLILIAASFSTVWSYLESWANQTVFQGFGKYTTYFICLMVISVSGANLSIKDDIKNKIGENDWRYNFFVYTNWIFLSMYIIRLLITSSQSDSAQKLYDSFSKKGEK